MSLQDLTNPLQNTSYTNKDFQTIYPEFINLADNISPKWKPSTSNESDPGVVLLKEAAILADKCNYNADMLALENFPLSVSQMVNARQLYNHLGYYMHWYRSATCDVTLKWIGEGTYEVEGYTIPKFSMIMDSENSVVYTIIGPANQPKSDSYTINDVLLPIDGSALSVKAIQGTISQYDINGETLINISNLDSKRRLYFPSLDVAENGIFITNKFTESDRNNFSDWVRKDNLLVENLSASNTFYEFGVSQDNLSCFIEFPENVEELFKDGIYVYYVRTLGADGNIAYNTLTQFYSTINPVAGSDIYLSTNNVKITNPGASVGGKNVETINEAYAGYKTTVGTFNTLVTLRDYYNYIINSNLVSNAVVTDRRNDIQSTYKIISLVDDIAQYQTMIDKNESDVPYMNSFSLKLYLLKLPVTDIVDSITYNESFNMQSNSQSSVTQAYIEDIKSISHEYQNILPTSSTRSNYCYFRNVYPINIKVITTYNLTNAQIMNLKSNINLALYKNLSSNNLDFGEAINYDTLYDIIVNSDERIKNIVMDNIEYNTYATYWVHNNLTNVDTMKNTLVSVEATNDDPNGLIALSKPEISCVIYDADDNIKFNTTTNQVSKKLIFTEDEGWNLIDNSYVGGIITYDELSFTRTSNQWVNDSLGSVDWLDLDINLKTEIDSDISDKLANGDKLVISISKSTQFRNEIYAKSVLAGKTPLYENDEMFDFSGVRGKTTEEYLPTPYDDPQFGEVDDIFKGEYSDTATYKRNDVVYVASDDVYTYYRCITKTISGESFNINHWQVLDSVGNSIITDIESVRPITTITINSTVNQSDEYVNSGKYVLRDGEGVQLFAPDLFDVTSFSSGVRYIFKTVDNSILVKANDTYELKDNEYIIFFYKENAAETYYTYRKYGKGTYFTTNFELPSVTTITQDIDVENLGTTGILSSINANEAVKRLRTAIASTQAITIKSTYKVVLDSPDKYCYWSTRISPNGDCILFEEGESTITLGTEEYFFYTTDAMTDLEVYGPGTTIQRSGDNLPRLAVPYIDRSEFLKLGVNAISLEQWLQISSQSPITVIKNQFIDIGDNYIVGAKYSGDKEISGWSLTINPLGSSGYIIEHVPTWSSNTSYIKDVKVVNNNSYYKALQDVPSNTSINNTNYWLLITSEDLKQPVTLSDFTLFYGKSEDALTDVAKIEASNISWDATSKLTFESSSIEAQKLLSNQALIIKQRVVDTVINNFGEEVQEVVRIPYVINGGNIVQTNDFTYYPTTILTTLPISSYGEEVYTYNQNLDGTYTYMNLFISRLYTASSDSNPIAYSTDGSVTILSSSQSVGVQKEYSIHTTMPAGEYIIPINNLDRGCTSLKVLYNNQPLADIYDSTEVVHSTYGNHYLYFKIDTDFSDVVLKIQYTSNSPTNLTISNFIKFVKPGDMSSNYFDFICKYINELDVNHIFNYIYEVPSDEKIINPLLAASFFDTNHIYNKNTIAQLDTATNITPVGKK